MHIEATIALFVRDLRTTRHRMHLSTVCNLQMLSMCFSLLHNEPFEIYPSTPEYMKLFEEIQEGETLRSDTLIVNKNYRHPAHFSKSGRKTNPKKDQLESKILKRWPLGMVVLTRTLR